MKQFMSILLALTLLCALFAACGDDDFPKPPTPQPTESAPQDEPTEPALINVCIDLPSATSRDIDNFFSYVPGNGKDFIVLTETIPIDEPERSTTLTRIRTEIMAGKGPDLFICSCYAPGAWEDTDGLFMFPNQAMERKMFLPLDSYIVQAKYMEWDRLLPVVMEAGRDEEGQQILPLAYTFDIYLLDKDRYSSGVGLPASWDELAESGNKLDQSLAHYASFYDLMGEVADYERDVPTFSEEELFDYAKKYADFVWREDQRGLLTPVFVFLTDGTFYNGIDYKLDLLNGREYDFYSSYNRSGGITADITVFGSINRNSKHPDEAFTVLDFLLSRNVQRNFSIYAYMHSLPVDMDVYSQEYPAHGQSMSDHHFQSFSALRDQINVAKFYTPAERILRDVIGRYSPSTGTEEDLKKYAHEQYVQLEMYLAES